MKKLIMTKGLPASGKTYWSEEQVSKSNGAIKRVNKDDLRNMIDCDKWSKSNEKHIVHVRNMIVDYYLSHGNTVIVDDTNLNPDHEKRLREIAEANKAQFDIKDFTDVSLEICIERDRKRLFGVGESVIRDMYTEYLMQKPSIQYRTDLLDAIICDIDGTLALFPNKDPYVRDFENDILNTKIADIIETYKDKYIIIYLSGRKDSLRDVTETWIKQNNLPPGNIFMRKSDDNRKDYIVKKELYDAHIKDQFNVHFILDDRNQVVKMWRSLGLTCLQVADGDF